MGTISGDLNEDRAILLAAYAEFNARKMVDVLNRLSPDVDWANGMEGGYVHGREGVRAYWTRQWTMIDPHVEPLSIEPADQGRVVVEVHQVVRDLHGKMLADKIVRHVYRFENGLIRGMDIE